MTAPGPSPLSRVVPVFLRLSGANRVFADADRARRHVEEVRVRPQPSDPPRRLRPDVTVRSGTVAGWPVHVLTPTGVRPRGAVVYLHGGAWIHQIVSQHWQLVAQIAVESRTTVVVPIYPLVPHGTAGEVVPGVAALVRRAVAEHGAAAVAGDSAGGQIALSTALLLRDEDGTTLRRTVLIAPAVDLTMTNPGIERVQPLDPWLARPGTEVFIDHWRGDLDVRDPRVSPLAGDLTGLGPLTVFTGTRDILNPDAHLLTRRARAVGVPVDLHERAGLVHVYPLTPTAEGRAARRTITRVLREGLAG